MSEVSFTFSLVSANLAGNMINPELASVPLWRTDSLSLYTPRQLEFSSKGSSDQFHIYLIPSFSVKVKSQRTKFMEIETSKVFS